MQSNQKRVESEINRLKQKKRKEMSSKERMRLLQLRLYLKSKQEKGRKFYILYDKLSLDYVLKEAYKRCKSNDGGPGIDGMRFEDVEEYGREKFLKELGEELRKRTYKPSAVKREWIDKENGGKRPLGIPTIKDRVAQQACKLVLEPIWEADFEEMSYGFRPKRSVADAVRQVKAELKKGKHDVYDADLSKYFDTIPHDRLEVALKERVSDPRVISLIKLWLKVPIVEEDGRYTGGKKHKEGTPQGGVISPLLANIYLHLLDRIVNNSGGYFAKHGIKMIRYADDFILMAEHIESEALDRLHGYINRMGLKINKEKSRQVKAKEESFDFLGFTVRYCRSIYGKGLMYWNIYPRRKSQKKIRQKINAKLKKIGHYKAELIPRELNPIIRGWMNHYKIDRVSYTQVAFKQLDNYLRYRLYRYYNRKSQRKSNLHGQQAYELLTEKYGLIVPYKSSGIRPVNVVGRK